MLEPSVPVVAVGERGTGDDAGQGADQQRHPEGGGDPRHEEADGRRGPVLEDEHHGENEQHQARHLSQCDVAGACGIWEMRGRPQHFVHSKVMCWAAFDRGVRLGRECLRQAPFERWEQAATDMRQAIEDQGYDADRGIFVQAFGSTDLDAALLLLPTVDVVASDDPRMVRTVDAVRDELFEEGLLRRYCADDRLDGAEGVFVACTFWLAECLAHQGRIGEARDAFVRVASTANDLGLFAEEFDPAPGRPKGTRRPPRTRYPAIKKAA